jgi:ABC-type uncharacterized transport system permease subunit
MSSMPLKTHLTILAQAVAAWVAFWVVGLPRYYQQYSQVAMGVACTLLSVGISLFALALLVAARPERRSSLARWLAFYYTVPFAALDTLYCGVYLELGWRYLADYWYLTVFYVTPWLTFPPTASLLARLDRRLPRPA